MELEPASETALRVPWSCVFSRCSRQFPSLASPKLRVAGVFNESTSREGLHCHEKE